MTRKRRTRTKSQRHIEARHRLDSVAEQTPQLPLGVLVISLGKVVVNARGVTSQLISQEGETFWELSHRDQVGLCSGA